MRGKQRTRTEPDAKAAKLPNSVAFGSVGTMARMIGTFRTYQDR